MVPSLKDADWLTSQPCKAIMESLDGAAGRTRFVGGVVRDALLGRPVGDIDMATEFSPQEAADLASRAGLKVIPTGIDHGTITILAHGTPIEVTTLRSDVVTYGRHAAVAFTKDWIEDARRRDFTINALYCSADGDLFDPVGAIDDLEAGYIRFIGDPRDRIKEDYLRILRFFRFSAWYGRGRPDGDGLKACASLRSGMDILSSERIWAELKRLLAAPDPTRSLLWMRTTNILQTLVPETLGTDALPPMIAVEREAGLEPDPLRRLQALIPADLEQIGTLSGRLRLSSRERERLNAWAKAPEPAPDRQHLSHQLYRYGSQPMSDRILAEAAAASAGEDLSVQKRRIDDLAWLSNWERPVFPISGRDLADLGVPAGPQMGKLLGVLEDSWIQSDFSLGREDLLTIATDKKED